MKKTYVVCMTLIALFLICTALLCACKKEEKPQPPVVPEVGTVTDDTKVPTPPDSKPEDESKQPQPSENDRDAYVMKNYATLEEALEALDATVVEAEHPNVAYAERFAEAVVNDQKDACRSLLEGDLFYGELKDIDYFCNTVFDGYELYPILLSDKYADYPSEDYLVNLKVVSTDNPALYAGNNFKLIRYPGEGGTPYFMNPDVLSAWHQANTLPPEVQLFSSSTLYGSGFSADSKPISANNLRDPYYLHNGFRYYAYLFQGGFDVNFAEYKPYSLNQINAFLSELISGFVPLTAEDLADRIDTLYFITLGIDENSLNITPDEPLYGCSAGHGGTSVYQNLCGVENDKNTMTVSYVLYSDPAYFCPSVRTNYVFDTSGDHPMLLEVSADMLSSIQPFSCSF